MATIQFKRRTSTGVGPLVGTTGSVKAGEPLVDFNGGDLYIAKADKTASSSNPLTKTDYLMIPSVDSVVNIIDDKIGEEGFGTAAYKSVGTSSGQIPVLNSSGKLADSVIPKIAMTNTFVVASKAAMLALTNAQEGDVAVRTDLNKTFILKAAGYNVEANWQELLTPTDAVQSVNGKTGAVTITLDDLGGVKATAFATHVTNGSHLTETQKEILMHSQITNIWENKGCGYYDTLTSFKNAVLEGALVLYYESDQAYSQNRKDYYLGIDKTKVLTPDSTIDGGTY